MVEIVPEIVAKKRNALTAKPLFYGEIVFNTIVIAGPIHDSAKRYSRASPSIATGKELCERPQSIMVGIPRIDPPMHTYDLIM